MVQTRRKRGFRNRLYSNMKLFLDDLFIARGFYDNIASGELDYEGRNLSQLFPVQNDPLYPVDSGSTVHVWQGYRKNWVSESGVEFFASGLTAPTLASGIYIGGTFHPRATISGGGNGIAIDFRNGRVLAESGITASATVEVAHSYKEIWIDTVARDLVADQVTVIDNTKRVAIDNVPSGNIIRLPAIQMDLANQLETRGLELGGGIIMRPVMFLHVVAENRHDKDEIVDVLQLSQFKTMTMVDLDAVPAQFGFYGDYGSGYKSYGQLKNSYKDRNAFIEQVDLVSNDDIAPEGYYTAVLRVQFRVDIPEIV